MNEFLWRLRVYYEDTDSGGVVYHANYLRFMERARTEWLRSLGFEQDELAAQEGILFAVRRLRVDFKRPARLNDALTVSARISKRGKASLDFYQEVRKPGKKNDLLCSAEVNIVCVSASRLRPSKIPERIFAEICDGD